jgi:hypothetical protein
VTSKKKILEIARAKCDNIKNNSKRRRAIKGLVKMLEKKFAEAL